MAIVRNNPSKWATRSGQASGDYASGVASPRRPWAESTAAAQDNFAAGVNQAVAEGRFARGVQAAGDAKYRRGVEEKGRTRYQQGVAVAQDDYSRGFAPYKTVLEGLSLPPRGPKGQNYGRVQAVGEALRGAKQGR